MNSRCYFGKMNSILGSVVPLAMFYLYLHKYKTLGLKHKWTMMIYDKEMLCIQGNIKQELEQFMTFVILRRPPLNLACRFQFCMLSSIEHCEQWQGRAVSPLLKIQSLSRAVASHLLPATAIEPGPRQTSLKVSGLGISLF